MGRGSGDIALGDLAYQHHLVDGVEIGFGDTTSSFAPGAPHEKGAYEKPHSPE